MRMLFSATLTLSALILVQNKARPDEPQTKAPSPPIAPLKTDIEQAKLIARLEERLPQLMKEGKVPGLAIALIRDGELVWHHGFGVKNSKTKDPVDDATVFEAASLSKPVFAYAVLKLVDAGKFDLDKPLNKYMPGNFDVDDVRLSQMTARHVLTHTTGFSNGYNGKNRKMFFAPGERFSYSGEGFEYLWMVIEYVTGEQLNDFVKRMVFQPLRMDSSSFTWLDAYDKCKASRHNLIGESTGQDKPPPERAKLGNLFRLHTTTEDYGRFVCAMLKGTGLKPETWKLMLTPQVQVREGGASSIDRPQAKPVRDVAWGLGWGLQTTKDGLSFWHWGDAGDSKAFIVAFDRPKLAVVFFANSANGLSIAREIVTETVGGAQPGLDWLGYERYNSPRRALFEQILFQGATVALREYSAKRDGRTAAEAISDNQMVSLGYDLLGLKRVEDAVEVFKLNVSLHPASWNAYDSLAEGYEANGDRVAAIKNFKRSLELNPQNDNATEHLKKLEGQEVKPSSPDPRKPT
jgi:CubicO group peptidase (beta-lactamase class C family)